MRGQNRNADLALAANRSKGLATRRELLNAGFSGAAIDRRIANGSLIREYPGVYRVGHAAPSTEASYLAAVLACGDDSALSGLPGAWLWSIIRGKPPPPAVSTPTERRIDGLVTHRRRLHPSEVTCHRGIPVTSVPLTLVDIAAHLPLHALSRACHEAGIRYRTTPRQVSEVLARRPNAKGAASLREVISGDTPLLLSKLEERFLALLRAHDLPLPITNRQAGAHYVDCRWPEHKLTVELDSYRFHNSRHSWEADRRRERAAFARGDQFRRFTWGDVFERERVTLGELCAVLLARGHDA
jgi:hypothetical protein